MTGIDRRGDTPMEPPWPVDVLADLHAGVLDTTVSDALWPRVRRDPEAVAVLDALAATEAELAGLATITPAMPAHLAARLDAALADVVGQPRSGSGGQATEFGADRVQRVDDGQRTRVVPDLRPQLVGHGGVEYAGV